MFVSSCGIVAMTTKLSINLELHSSDAWTIHVSSSTVADKSVYVFNFM